MCLSSIYESVTKLGGFLKKHPLIFFITLWPLFLFFYTVRHIYNVPCSDDFGAIIQYVWYIHDFSFIDKLKSLFWQHNEHRVLVVRLLSIVLESIGLLNMKILSFLGMLFVFFSFIVSAKYILSVDKEKRFELIPMLALIYFTPFQYCMNTWSMAIISQAGVFFLSLVALYVLTQCASLFSLFGSIFVSFLCIFSNGIGFVLAIVSWYILLKSYYLSKMINKRYVCFVLCSTLFSLGYFYRYHWPKYHPPFYPDFEGYFVYLAKLIDVLSGSGDIFLGLGLSTLIFVLFFKNFRKQESLFPEGMMLFSLLSIAACVCLRSGFDSDSLYMRSIAVPERHIYPIIFAFASLVMFFRQHALSLHADKLVVQILFALLLVTFIVSYPEEFRKFKQFSKTNYENYLYYLKDGKPFWASEYIGNARSSYRFPENCSVETVSNVLDEKYNSQDDNISIHQIKLSKNIFFIDGRASHMLTNDCRMKILLKNEKKAYVITPKTQVFRKNFTLIFHRNQIAPGKYEVFVNFPEVNDLWYYSDTSFDTEYLEKSGVKYSELNFKNAKVKFTKHCQGHIDYSQKRSSNFLEVSGWLAKSIEKGQISNKNFIAACKPSGEIVFFTTEVQLRPDVSEAFNRVPLINAVSISALDTSGFIATINLSGMPEGTRLFSGQRDGEDIIICTNQNITRD